MLGRSLKDSATQFPVTESLNPRMDWLGKDPPAQPCSLGRDTFPWARRLQKDTHSDLLLENLFVFSPTQNNPIIPQSAQSRELCHCWHRADAAVGVTPAVPPHG